MLNLCLILPITENGVRIGCAERAADGRKCPFCAAEKQVIRANMESEAIRQSDQQAG